MSTFNGMIPELDNILVDNFTEWKSHTCFFLSHCHTDHMKCLDKMLPRLMKTHEQYLYCSETSRLILISKYGNEIGEVVKPLTTFSVIKVPENKIKPSYQVSVIPIPAGHCLGSLMFLFETMNKTILYTGDFRIAIGDTQKLKALHQNNKVKPINKLYLDSTFLNEIYWNFPLRTDVIDKLSIFVEEWLNRNPKHHVMLILSASYGYERVYFDLAKKLNCKIHVRNQLYDLCFNIPEIGSVLTNNCESTKLHAFGMREKKCSPCKSEFLLIIKLSAKWFKSSKSNVHKTMEFWQKNSEQILDFCYSNHSSCSELVDFLNYLQPEEVVPCVIPVESSIENQEIYISKLMGSWFEKQSMKSSGAGEPDFELKKNFKFEISFPKSENKTQDFFDV